MADLVLNGSSGAYTPPQFSVPLRLTTEDIVIDMVPGSAEAPGYAVDFWFGNTDVVLLDVSSAIYYPPEDKVNFGRDSTQPDIPKPQPPPNTIRAWGLRAMPASAQFALESRILAQQSQPLDVLARLRARQALQRDRVTRALWDATLVRDRQRRLAAASAPYQPDRVIRLLWVNPPAKDRAASLPWRDALDRPDHEIRMLWDYPPPKDRGPLRLPWQSSQLDQVAGAWFDPPAGIVPADQVDFAFTTRLLLAGTGTAYLPPTAPVQLALVTEPPAVTHPPVDFSFKPIREPRTGPHGVDHRIRLDWGDGTHVDARHVLRWGKGQPTQHEVGSGWTVEPDPPDPDVPTIPRMGVYVVSNAVSVVRLPERTPIGILGVTASLDYTSWAWNVQVTLTDAAGLTLLTPTSSGPKEIEISINGFTLTAIAESYQRAWSFGRQTWVVTGRSRSAWLAAPYAPLRSLVSSSLSAASQLATDELSGTGWTLDWQAQDWNVDVGQFSYQDLAPIDAISKLAAAVGGTVQPDPSAKSLVVQSRYPISPSGWASATPDAIIPSSVLTRLGMQWQPAVQYNAAYITGGTQGVNVNATVSGTAGDNPIPATIQDPLITTVEAGTERARIELVSGGNKIQVTGEAPIMSPVGVLLPGKLIEVDEADTWRGLIQATSIVAKVINASDVRQTLTIERRPS